MKLYNDKNSVANGKGITRSTNTEVKAERTTTMPEYQKHKIKAKHKNSSVEPRKNIMNSKKWRKRAKRINIIMSYRGNTMTLYKYAMQ